jgi:hypothetical protein
MNYCCLDIDVRTRMHSFDSFLKIVVLESGYFYLFLALEILSEGKNVNTALTIYRYL